MKYKFLLVMLLVFMVAPGYSQLSSQLTPQSTPMSARFFNSIRLSEGDSICVSIQYPNEEYCARERKICTNFKNQVLSASALRTYEIDKHEDDLNRILEYSVIGLYDGYPFQYRMYYLFSNSYFRGLIKTKAAREYGYKAVTDLAVELCNYFPKDFKVKLVSELTELQNAIKQCKKHRYEGIKDNDGILHLYVDGRQKDDLAYTMEGMVARRICMDNIPAAELDVFVTSLLNKLKQVKTENAPDVLYMMTINNELSYCRGIEGPFFIFENNKKKTLPFENKDYMLTSSYGQKVIYRKGSNGGYIIRNQYLRDGACSPLPQYYRDLHELILDSRGNEISRK